MPSDFRWDDTPAFEAGYKRLTDMLRPWTIDFHVAQNNGEVFGSGSHDKTGRHCLPNAPDGKLDVVKYAGYWLRDDDGEPNKRFEHICWDGCMFPNETLMNPRTWNDILAMMVAVRDAHGWNDIIDHRGHRGHGDRIAICICQLLLLRVLCVSVVI